MNRFFALVPPGGKMAERGKCTPPDVNVHFHYLSAWRLLYYMSLPGSSALSAFCIVQRSPHPSALYAAVRIHQSQRRILTHPRPTRALRYGSPVNLAHFTALTFTAHDYANTLRCGQHARPQIFQGAFASCSFFSNVAIG